MTSVRTVSVVIAALSLPNQACVSRVADSEGGAQATFKGPRQVDPSDIALPAGYRIEPVVTGLTFPTDVAFDDRGRLYVVEAGYSYGNVTTVPRILRVEPGGELEEIARGDNPPWNGAAFHRGQFFVAAGHMRPGELLRVGLDGSTEVVIDGLTTSVGDHQVNGPEVGPDGMIYFAQGPLTNSAVVGIDNYHFGWLKRYPDAHDVPCADVVLAGRNYTTPNPLTEDPDDQATTGAYMPFGKPSEPGQVVAGKVPCGGAIMRVAPGGGEVELVAWGLRNPYGLAFSPDGQLYATDNQYDARGSRPVWGTGDLLWRIEDGRWYGWPDFWSGRPLTDGNWFSPPGQEEPGFVLAEHPEARPPEARAKFGVHSSSSGLTFSRSPAFGHAGQAFVAQFGDIAPVSGKSLSPVGFKVVRVEPDTGVVHDFAVNEGETNGPASKLESGGLERPLKLRFSPDGTALYVADFGVMTASEKGVTPRKRTGVVWKITRRSRP